MRLVAVWLLVFLWWGALDTASALQCGGKIVSLGYHTWKVREICGDPSDAQEVQQLMPQRYYDPYQRLYVDTFVPVPRTIWTYNFGSNRLIYVLTFERDKLVDIATDGYGH